MSVGATCTLKANGVKVADGYPSFDPTTPTALSGLSITWGRSTTVDQPDVSTLVVQLLDEPGGSGFRDLFAVGTPISVEASALTYPNPTVSTFPNADLESGPPNVNATGGTVIYGTDHPHSGTHAARIHRANAESQAAVNFTPLPFVPNGTDPGAWDEIPRTAVGQSWQVGAWLRVPAGSIVELYPVLYPAPWAGTGIVGARLATQAATPYAFVGGNFTPPPGYWVGIRVVLLNSALLAWDSGVGTWDAQAGTWDELADVFVDDLTVLAPSAGVAQTVLVWSGRVTNQQASKPDGSESSRLQITAADFTADLANCDIGDEPWASESMAARFQRIVNLSGFALPVTIAPTVSAIPISWRDVDNQPAAGLLSELTSSVDGILWAATHSVTGPYLEVEDPGVRPPDQTLKLVGGVVEIVEALDTATPISACDLPQDSVQWNQDVGDVVTRSAIGWLEQVPPDADDPSVSTLEHTHTTIDPVRESKYGQRRYGVETQLITDADAANVATRILNRTQLGWRASGLTVDDSFTEEMSPPVLLSLLDGTSRNGLLLKLDELPEWSPVGAEVGVYLEGGTYRFDDGWWVLDLTVSSARSSGQSVVWNQPPAAWTWNSFDPAISWDDLTGVGIAA